MAYPAAPNRPAAGLTMASAGISKTSTGRYKVWWRLEMVFPQLTKGGCGPSGEVGST